VTADGTTNFAHGSPASAFRSLLPSGISFCGRGLQSFYNELLPRAQAKAPTFNGKKIHVSKVARFPPACFAPAFPCATASQPTLQYYGDFTQHSHGVRRDGSAALDLASVAAGRFDGFWNLTCRNGTPRGRPAGRDAGGKVSDFAPEIHTNLAAPSFSPPTD